MKTQLETPIGVSESAHNLLDRLVDLPLASVRDLQPLSDRGSTVVYQRLGKLRDHGLVDSASLGWYGSTASRWFLTDQALFTLGRLDSTWHEEGNRCRLLERLPSLEWFYRVVPEIKDLGAFQSFHWLDKVSIDAVVRYRHGWVAMFWSGIFQSEEAIAARLERLGKDLRELSVSREAPWPGLLVFVTSDQWQRELVYRAARRYNLQDQVAVWCARDGTRAGARNAHASRGWISQPIEFRSTGGWSWEQRLQASPWVERRGDLVGQVFDVISQWPGAALKMVRQDLREAPTGRTAQNACNILYARGFIDRLWDAGRYRYRTTSRGVDRLARRDRVHYSDCTDRVDSLSWVNQVGLRAHEDGVMSIMDCFLARGLHVAAGWRSWEHLGLSGGIAPDGLVFLERSPYGPTWAYLEYERTAKGEARVQRKLRSYGSVRRGDHWPVLLVCWDESAESNFQQVGLRTFIPMLTTTIERLEEHGPLDNLRCWSIYGTPALIG